MSKSAYIVDAVRTPRARKKGKLSELHPVDLLAYPLKALVERNSLPASAIEDVYTGCVTQVKEQAWCIARAAVLACGWPIEIPAVTINRLCGSSLQAANFAASSITAGTAEVIVASGVEHMTRVPMMSDCGGEPSPALKYFHPDLVAQGVSAERICQQWKLTRTQVDEYALKSQRRAAAAQANGYFKKSIVPVAYTSSNGQAFSLAEDDNLRPDTTIEGLSALKTPFQDDGVLTAGNSSAIVDGASAILVTSEAALAKYALKPRAKIISQVAIGSDPYFMLTGPIEAARKLVAKAGLSIADINLWEINEAFAPIPLITIEDLGLDPELVNVNGGAIALGHPLGATGTILIGSLLDELERRQLKYGAVLMCVGLGMGVGTLIERV